MSSTDKKPVVYLDYAAATPLDDDVLRAMQPYWQDQFYNPSAVYLASRHVKKDLQNFRHDVAKILGARSHEIVFTAGGSESVSLAINGVMKVNPGKKILFSGIEHEAVIETAMTYSHQKIAVTSDGIIDIDELKKSIDDDVVLISVMYANNEIGTVQPINEIAEMIDIARKDRKSRSVSTPIYLHSDACQASNYLDLHVNKLQVDLMSLNGSKIYAPKQSGCLYIRAGTALESLVKGGGQEGGFRSGTENVAFAAGFARALRKSQVMRKDEVNRLSQIQKSTVKQLKKDLPNVEINGSMKRRLPNNLNFTLPKVDGETILMMMDEAGFQIATGSACAALSDESSYVIKALGHDDEYAGSSLRISMGRSTSKENMEAFVLSLTGVHKQYLAIHNPV